MKAREQKYQQHKRDELLNFFLKFYGSQFFPNKILFDLESNFVNTDNLLKIGIYDEAEYL